MHNTYIMNRLSTEIPLPVNIEIKQTIEYDTSPTTISIIKKPQSLESRISCLQLIFFNFKAV